MKITRAALMSAIKNNDAQAVTRVIGQGADVNELDANGDPPLTWDPSRVSSTVVRPAHGRLIW